MPIAFSTPVLSNTAQIGANQSRAQTVALKNGGYVMAWDSDFGGSLNVYFQRYDAFGAPVGTATIIDKTPGTDMALKDIEAQVDGTFSILTLGSVGGGVGDERLFVSSFFAATGGPSGPPAVLNLTALAVVDLFGAQLVADPDFSNSLVVAATAVDGTFNYDLVRSVVTTSGTVLQLPTVVTNNHTNTTNEGITELIQGIDGEQFAIVPSGIVDTVGTSAFIASARDILSLQPGVFVVASAAPLSPQVALSLFASTKPDIATYSLTGGLATNVAGATTSGTRSYDVELVDLGSGRIMIVWVADGGDSVPGGTPFVDGVYAQVYDMNIGGAEGNATLIKSFGVGSNGTQLANIALSADRMADGRVALGLSYINGISGLDVFSTVLDARVEGVDVTATSGADSFLGSAFDDTFSGLLSNDGVNGGAGMDTVVFTDAAAHNIDLGAPQNFPATTLVLTSIENLTGNAATDDLRGSEVANILLGSGGNDILQGRAGEDTLGGGSGDDLLRGDEGDDLLRGDSSNDTLFGGFDHDLLFGGGSDDMLRGDAGNDTLSGDTGNDQLLGGTWDDSLSGDDGNDILDGGQGDDTLAGGAGDDTLRGGHEEGADQLLGGAGNDVLRVQIYTGVSQTKEQFIEGGAGSDTLVIGVAPFSQEKETLVDLSGDFNIFGLENVYTRLDAIVTAVENVTGSRGNDFIGGDDGINVLRGGQGDDFIFSRGGNDTLFGNAGVDVFIFTAPGGGTDRLADFEMASDKIWLAQGGFGDINGFNLATRLTVNATGTVGATALAQLIYDNAGAGSGTLSFDADGNGAGAAVVLAILVPTTGDLVALTASNFAFL